MLGAIAAAMLRHARLTAVHAPRLCPCGAAASSPLPLLLRRPPSCICIVKQQYSLAARGLSGSVATSATKQRGGGSKRADGADGSADKPTPAPPPPPSPHVAALLKQLASRLPPYCCGCGVKLQQGEPDAPGFYQVPRRIIDVAEQQAAAMTTAGGADGAGDVLSDDERARRAFDLVMEALLDEHQKPQGAGGDGAAMTPPKGERLSSDADRDAAAAAAADIRCARCYSLTHHGKIKSQAAEAALPAFDLGRKVGRKIALQRDRRALVLAVVDIWDFDGSLPRQALSELFPNAGADPAALGAPDAPFKLAVAVNKADLLPPGATRGRVEQWVRSRLRQAGLPRPDAVYLVSALSGAGVAEMTESLVQQMGFRSDLWVVGAQNAGKSSLITAIKRQGGAGATPGRGGAGSRGGEPTVAPVPGTTLGLLRVPGMPLGPKHRVFDTPGVHHPHQLGARLTLDELGDVLPRKRLKPRTYRLPAGRTLLLGGLARVDVLSLQRGTSLYLTVYASDRVVVHCGKTDGADERRAAHAGALLTPPRDAARLEELGPLLPRDVEVEGASWARHSRDVAIAGLGWLGVGVDGAAALRVWAPEGVAVTVHDALDADFAKEFQKPGFDKS